MYKFLLSNGCSFLTQRKGVKKHTGILLSDYLGLEHIGLGCSGKGNDRLILTTKLFFYEKPERIKDTFVLIGWTNPARIDYIDNYLRPSYSTSNVDILNSNGIWYWSTTTRLYRVNCGR